MILSLIPVSGEGEVIDGNLNPCGNDSEVFLREVDGLAAGPPIFGVFGAVWAPDWRFESLSGKSCSLPTGEKDEAKRGEG